jgi:hypothetical protein
MSRRLKIAPSGSGEMVFGGGAIHDFVMLNALRGTNAAKAAIAQAAEFLAAALQVRRLT